VPFLSLARTMLAVLKSVLDLNLVVTNAAALEVLQTDRRARILVGKLQNVYKLI
jgi:hypothetical protein